MYKIHRRGIHSADVFDTYYNYLKHSYSHKTISVLTVCLAGRVSPVNMNGLIVSLTLPCEDRVDLVVFLKFSFAWVSSPLSIFDGVFFQIFWQLLRNAPGTGTDWFRFILTAVKRLLRHFGSIVTVHIFLSCTPESSLTMHYYVDASFFWLHRSE